MKITRLLAVAFLLCCVRTNAQYASPVRQQHFVCVDTTGKTGPCLLIGAPISPRIPSGDAQFTKDDMDKWNKEAQSGAGLDTLTTPRSRPFTLPHSR